MLQAATAGVLHSVTLLHSVRDLRDLQKRRPCVEMAAYGPRALGVHAASQPGFASSAVPGSGRVARPLSATRPVSHRPPGSSTPAAGAPVSIGASGPLLNHHRFRISRPPGEPPGQGAGAGVGPAQAEPSSIPETAALGACPGCPREGWPRGSVGPACACPAGLLSTHCLPSLNGPTVIGSQSLACPAPLLCTARPGAPTLTVLHTTGASQARPTRGPPPLPSSQSRAHAGQPAACSDCLPASGLPTVAQGRPGCCPAAYRVSGAAVRPGRAFAPVPAGSALLTHRPGLPSPPAGPLGSSSAPSSHFLSRLHHQDGFEGKSVLSARSRVSTLTEEGLPAGAAGIPQKGPRPPGLALALPCTPRGETRWSPHRASGDVLRSGATNRHSPVASSSASLGEAAPPSAQKEKQKTVFPLLPGWESCWG